jgi:D-alanyl-D-alanine carboxypeptidase
VSRLAPLGLCLLIAGAIVATLISAADARQSHRSRHPANKTSAHGEDRIPAAAAIVVDGTSGAVLQASNADVRCHPASLTKVMTLYLLFERLETGAVHLGDSLEVSEHASKQAPSKLDLGLGETITVEDAIKAIVTKSANDAAVAVAERLGQTEENFAKLMTQQARALGMMDTIYLNASGLPDDGQVTTAKDQALLARAIQKRFPEYYKYFATEAFVFRGETFRNHNHLLGTVEGIDGIKTGYTRSSGFNLIASVHRGGRSIIAVILGGKSASERDEHMRKLIATYAEQATVQVDSPAQHQSVALVQETPDITERRDIAERHDVAEKREVAERREATDPIQALIVKTLAAEAEQPTPLSAVLSGATPIRSTDFSKPSGQVAARWPSPSEVFAPFGSSR